MGFSGNVFRIFLFFSSFVYDWFIALPEPIKWSGATVFIVVLVAMAFTMRRRFPRHLNSFRSNLRQLYGSLWTFLMGGIILKVVYPLTMSILPFYSSLGFWVVITWEASLIGFIYLLRKPEWVVGLQQLVVRWFQQAFHTVQRL